ncbi:MAG: T9SS type A sorting domain-containing protein [Bacteroidota bacterium]
MKKTLSFFFLIFFVQNSFSQNFYKEIVSSLGPGTSVGIYCNVAIGKDNVIHFSHYDYLNKDLLYTTNASGQWETSIIDSTGQTGEYNSIAIDSNNHAHISYFEYIRNDSIAGGTVPYGNLKYATNASGQWATSTIDTASGLLTRICVDKQNFIHIVHSELGIGDPVNHLLNIKYTTNKSGAWQSEAIAPGVVKGADGSIASDNNLNIHIAIRNEEGVGTSPDGGIGGLRYITNNTGNWSWFDVDTNFYAGNDVDIAIDTNGFPHISYLDKNLGLKHATNQSGSWTYSVLDTNHNVGWNTSIIIDKDNYTHICYSDPSPLIDTTGNGYLKFVSNTSGSWDFVIVDSTDAGMYTCIVLDTADLPHIAYTALNPSDGSGVLKHAFRIISTGYDDIKSDINILSLYPNPSAGSLLINCSNLPEGSEIKIYDVKGCYHISFPVNNGINMINTSDLSPGMYFLYIRSGDVIQKSIKFIKQ